MKRIAATLFFVVVVAAQGAQPAQDEAEQRHAPKAAKKKARVRCPDLSISNLHVDLGDLEASLREVQFAMTEPPPLDMSPLQIELPPIDLNLPFIPPIPAIDLPDIDLDGMSAAIDCGESPAFRHLSDEEELQIKALQELASLGADDAIKACERVIDQSSHHAVRHEAVAQLGKFLDDQRAVAILARVAKADRSLKVRKCAIALLGKSQDPRALQVLQELVIH